MKLKWPWDKKYEALDKRIVEVAGIVLRHNVAVQELLAEIYELLDEAEGMLQNIYDKPQTKSKGRK